MKPRGIRQKPRRYFPPKQPPQIEKRARLDAELLFENMTEFLCALPLSVRRKVHFIFSCLTFTSTTCLLASSSTMSASVIPCCAMSTMT